MNHVKTCKEHRGLHTILHEWVRLNQILGRQWSTKAVDDIPWWYNERALLGLFAGAIWKTGGYAFEEFFDLKHKREEKCHGNGRVDLWFQTSGGEYRAEAKAAQIRIDNKSNQLAKLQSLMSRAIADAGCNPVDGRSHRLAIAFGVPYLSEDAVKSQRRALLDGFLELAEKVDHNAIAWAFPSLPKLPARDGWVCPGIVIWIKIVKRSP